MTLVNRLGPEELADVLDHLDRGVHRQNVVPQATNDEAVTAGPTPGIQYSAPSGDVAQEPLIEVRQVDIQRSIDVVPRVAVIPRRRVDTVPSQLVVLRSVNTSNNHVKHT